MNTVFQTKVEKKHRLSLQNLQNAKAALAVNAPPKSDHQAHPRIGSRIATAKGFENRQPLTAATRHQALPRPRVPGGKRLLDIICITLSLPLILPLMALIVFWIRLVSRGPALLRQKRIGRDGQPFVLYKFRSMKLNSDSARHESYLKQLVQSDQPMIKLDLLCDTGLIAGGCLLRSSGLDELPQLLNVIRGEMSLVGPRPCLPGEYAFFSTRQRERFEVLPGLTGIWQVYGKNQASFREMNVMDIHYVRHATLMMDLHIMMRTPAALLCQMLLALQHKFTSIRSLALLASGREPDQGGPSHRHSQLQ